MIRSKICFSLTLSAFLAVIHDCFPIIHKHFHKIRAKFVWPQRFYFKCENLGVLKFVEKVGAPPFALVFINVSPRKNSTQTEFDSPRLNFHGTNVSLTTLNSLPIDQIL